ncbi:hypothetical protein OIU76_003791 [Salix suchowensis]|nr:hypothetical protein OIU76_003791 [Salix suchowensis]
MDEIKSIMWCVPGNPESPPTTPDSKLKRKAPDANRDQERKKEVDRAYRQRCREKKIKNEENLCVLAEENNRLQRENDHIKKEEERLKEVVQTQNGFMKKLQDKFSQLKTQLDNQITLVDVLSKELVRLSFYLLLYFNSVIFLQQSTSYIFLQWLYFQKQINLDLSNRKYYESNAQL